MSRFAFRVWVLTGFALAGCAAPVPPPEEVGESRQQEAAPQQAPTKSREETEASAPPVFRGHAKHIDYVAFSADYTKLVTASNAPGDRTGRIWDARTGRELAQFTIPRVGDEYGTATDLWFTADGRKVVTEHHRFLGPDDPKIRVWEADTGRLLREMRDPDDEMRKPVRGPARGDGRWPSVIFSGDGQRKMQGDVVSEVATGKPILGMYGARLVFATNGVLAPPYYHVIRSPDGIETSLRGLALSEDGSRALCWKRRYTTKTIPAVQDGVHPTMPISNHETVDDAIALIDIDKGAEIKQVLVPKESSTYQLHFFRDKRPMALIWNKEGTTLKLVSAFP